MCDVICGQPNNKLKVDIGMYVGRFSLKMLQNCLMEISITIFMKKEFHFPKFNKGSYTNEVTALGEGSMILWRQY